jgi:hypothetical protein
MATLFWLGIAIFVPSVILVNLSRTPNGANIGMICSLVGICLIAAAGLWKTAQILF